MKKVLVILAHPDLEISRINKALFLKVRDKPDLIVSDLYKKYPNFNINVLDEQALLLEADVIIFQHPLYWYNCPPLLKQWIDKVLLSGFAYGPGGNNLTGKLLFSAISADAAEKDYHKDGHNKYSIKELLRPFELTANYCKLKYVDPFVIYDTYKVTDIELDELALKYRALIDSLQNMQYWLPQ